MNKFKKYDEVMIISQPTIHGSVDVLHKDLKIGTKTTITGSYDDGTVGIECSSYIIDECCLSHLNIDWRTEL